MIKINLKKDIYFLLSTFLVFHQIVDQFHGGGRLLGKLTRRTFLSSATFCGLHCIYKNNFEQHKLNLVQELVRYFSLFSLRTYIYLRRIPIVNFYPENILILNSFFFLKDISLSRHRHYNLKDGSSQTTIT